MSLALKTKTLPVIMLICWLSTNSLAQAADAGVRDDAKLFSSETVKKADDILKDIQQKTKKIVVIETHRGIPASKREAFQANRDKFYAEWSIERAKALGLQRGTLCLIVEETRDDVSKGNPSKHIEFWSDGETRKIFTPDDATNARKTLGKLFNSDPNQAFLNMVGEIKTTMETKYAATHPLAGAVEKGVANNHDLGSKPVNHPKEGGMEVTTIVIYLVVGLLGFWILIGLVRAFTRPRVQPGDYNAPPPPPGMGRGGMAPPPPGYGQGYGGQPMGYPPQQSGGMGFMGSLMTGMLGAAAGNFMYDRFFRGGNMGSSDYGGSSASTGGGYFGGGSRSSEEPGYTTGGDLPADDNTSTSGGANYDQDIAGGSGDFGSGSTGGDYGGGSSGGDFGGGGGGDFGGGGGGGDFGGGGGDSGGGDF